MEVVTTDLGAPRLEREEIPMEGTGRCVEEPVLVGGEELTITALSMGNPHAVAFVGSPEARASKLGGLLEHHPLFPDRVNAGFARVLSDGSLELVVHERGCGLTAACGTGAAAAMVAAVLTGRLPVDSSHLVRQAGGNLEITVSAGLGAVRMTGPAELAFEGRIQLPAAGWLEARRS